MRKASDTIGRNALPHHGPPAVLWDALGCFGAQSWKKRSEAQHLEVLEEARLRSASKGTQKAAEYVLHAHGPHESVPRSAAPGAAPATAVSTGEASLSPTSETTSERPSGALRSLSDSVELLFLVESANRC